MRLLFLGCGNMAQALFGKKEIWQKANDQQTTPVQLFAYSPSGRSGALFAELTGAEHFSTPKELSVDAVVLGFKPQMLAAVFKQWSPLLPPQVKILSLLAGKSSQQIQELFPQAQVSRLMPNTPSQVSLGIHLFKGDLDFWGPYLYPSGDVIACKSDGMIDQLTPFSGSGPAYFFEICHQLEQVFKKHSSYELPEAQLRKLIAGTMKGAAEMLLGAESATDLRDKVTSKGGVTAAALTVFKQEGLSAMIEKAIIHAWKRNQELSQE